MKHRLFGLCGLALLSVALTANAADVKIIANPAVAVSSISADELKQVFLITKAALSDGSHVQPVVAKAGSAHETFLKSYLGKSDAALTTYYRSLVFTGKGAMPAAFGSDGEIVAYVAKTRGAIGYVSSGAPTNGVKTLDVK